MARANARVQHDREASLSDLIPFSSEVAEGVIKLKGQGAYLISYEIDGIEFETADDDYLLTASRDIERMALSLDPGSALWIHRIKSERTEDFQPGLRHPFAREVHARYMERLNKKRFVRTQQFVTFVLRQPRMRAGFNSLAALTRHEVESIEAVRAMATRSIAAIERPYRARRLGVYTQGDQTCSELQEFLYFLANGCWARVPLATRCLDEHLAGTRMTVAQRSGVIQLNHPDGEIRFASPIEIQTFPAAGHPRQLTPLFYVQAEYIETHSYSALAPADAADQLRRRRNLMISGGQASTREVEDLDLAVDALRRGAIGAGEYHYSLMLLSKDLERVKSDRALVQSALEQGGFKSVVQTTVPECAWAYQCPGNWRDRTRVAIVTSTNFAHFAPLHNFGQGKREGNPWGRAVCVFDSPSGQPYFFNFHASHPDKDETDRLLPGNTVIFGRTGVGKTTLEMFLLTMLDQFDTRVVVLDMDRSTEIGIRRLGGAYRCFLRGQSTGINPFQWPDTPVNRAFNKRLVTQLVTKGIATLSAEEEHRISSAVDTVYAVPPEQRRLGIVSQNLPRVGSNSLADRLRRWVGSGDLAWVLDNPKDELDLQSNTRFGWDYSEFIDDAEICPAFVMCLLHCFETMLDGRPLALFMEEFWKPLQHPAFSSFVRDKVKTIRKEGGIVVLTTQQPDDVLDHPLAKTVVQQSVTGIYLPNDKAILADYLAFGLTPAEFDIVKSLPMDSRGFLVKQDGKSSVCRFDLSGMDDLIKIFSGAKESVQRLDSIRDMVGDDPAAWAPIFLGSAR